MDRRGVSGVIDFRYHVVSLVAVFIALAVGIVLGAGPLRGQLSDTIEGQVAELGEERNVLRADLTLQESRADSRDQVLDEVAPDVVQDILAGQTVAIVELPDADSDTVDDVVAAVTQAGATDGPRVQVLDEWDDNDNASQRSAAADEMAALWGADLATAPDPAAAALATSITGWGPSGGRYPVEVGQEVLEDAGLISVSSASAGDGLPVSLVIVVGGSAPAGDEGTASVDPQQLALATALAQTESEVLVAGQGTEEPSGSAEETPANALVTDIRADSDLSVAMTTVDNSDTALGRLSVVWGLLWLSSDQVGHYGFASDAGATNPPDPATSSNQAP